LCTVLHWSLSQAGLPADGQVNFTAFSQGCIKLRLADPCSAGFLTCCIADFQSAGHRDAQPACMFEGSQAKKPAIRQQNPILRYPGRQFVPAPSPAGATCL
jgi:hypothetical protein